MKSDQIQPLSEHGALSERVYHAILKLFTQGAMESNSTIRIDTLANALKVSPTPVREALARLEATGLVERQERRGYRVPPPLGAEQVEELMEARELIEVACLVHAVDRGGKAFKTALVRALREQQAAAEAYQVADALGQSVRSQQFWAVVDADLAFHAVIVEHAGNPFLALMANALQGQQHRVRQSAEHGISDALDALREHQAVVDSVLAGDLDEASSKMRAHMTAVGERAMAQVDQQPN